MEALLAVFDLFKEFVYFIVRSTLSLSFMLVFIAALIAVIATPIVIGLILTHKIPFIVAWDRFWDSIVPIAEKGFVVAIFIFFFTAAGSWLDAKLGTSVEFSSLSGVVGAIVGVRFLFII